MMVIGLHRHRSVTSAFHIIAAPCLHEAALNQICKCSPEMKKASVSLSVCCIHTFCCFTLILTLSLLHHPAAFCTLQSQPPASPWCWGGPRTHSCFAGCCCGSVPVPPAVSGLSHCIFPALNCNASQCHEGQPPGTLSVKRLRKSTIVKILWLFCIRLVWAIDMC